MHSGQQGRIKTAVCDIEVEDMPKCRPIARIQAYTILPDRAATGRPLGRGGLADYMAGMRSLTVAARIGASRSSTFMSRTRSPTTDRHGPEEPCIIRSHQGTKVMKLLHALGLSAGLAFLWGPAAGANGRAAHGAPKEAVPILIDFPEPGSIFPPDITPPTFLWRETTGGAIAWRVEVQFGERGPRVKENSLGEKPHIGEIDTTLVGYVPPDRKSTRLNSSHLGISYAVFCLKKKYWKGCYCAYGWAHRRRTRRCARHGDL